MRACVCVCVCVRERERERHGVLDPGGLAWLADRRHRLTVVNRSFLLFSLTVTVSAATASCQIGYACVYVTSDANCRLTGLTMGPSYCSVPATCPQWRRRRVGSSAPRPNRRSFDGGRRPQPVEQQPRSAEPIAAWADTCLGGGSTTATTLR